jgi:hypothetical protein
LRHGRRQKSVHPTGPGCAGRAAAAAGSDDPTFDVTVTAGPTGVAVRVHHPAGLGPVAGLVAGPDAEQSQAAESAPSPVAWELAELLRRGHVGPR